MIFFSKNILLLILSLLLTFSVAANSISTPIIITDSIPPPPLEPDTLTGPEAVCQTEVALYTMDFPVDCAIEWYIDDVQQGSDSTILQVEWQEPGNHLIKACCYDLSSVLDTLSVMVAPLPVVDLGNDTTLNEGETILLDAGNPGAKYLWSTNDTTQTILVNETGLYSVIVTNDCGNGYDEIYVDILTSIYSNSKPSITFRTINNTLSIIGLDENANIEICSIYGKQIYSGKNRNNIRVNKNQIVVIKIKSGKTDKTFKIFIP